MRYLQQKSNMLTQQVIKQASGQQQNQRVYKVDLCSQSITRINGLRSFSRLRCLQLGFNRIQVIENMEYLTDLRQLHLEYNEISHISGLQTNKTLTTLNLNSNKIKKLQNLNHLNKLQILQIDNNILDKIIGLENLKQLKYLSVSGNKLISIDSLPAFSKLQTLIADNNSITGISAGLFQKSKNLMKLSLAYNLLEDASFAGSLSFVDQINLANNNLRQIGFGPLKNLQWLNVSNNKIGKLPKICVNFPSLSSFLFANNQIYSEFELIQAFAQADMLVQVDYTGNLMDIPNFADTLYKLYGYDRINNKNYNKQGTSYLCKANEIQQFLQEQGVEDIQDDEQYKKIMRQGFYNDDLEYKMTGVKPQRHISDGKHRTQKLNFDEMEKSYKDIVDNQKRLQFLRNQCLQIFESNGIEVKIPGFKKEQEHYSRQILQESSVEMVTEPKNLANKTTSINTIERLTNKNQENMSKWKQLKNREKSFNIRGIIRKMSGSQRKSGTGTIEGSVSKQLPEMNQLMRTQLHPPRWNNDPALMRVTLQGRPSSSKKK